MAAMTDLSTAPTEVLNATFCATLVDEWIRAGVTDAVISPGSRSTPMALALADRPEVAVHVHHDERAAGFTALGLGLASGRPAVVLTTSGTAAVELHPAVVEAHQAAVAMIVATADRPPELHHVGAPQTVDQNRLFGTSVRWFVDPGTPSADGAPSWRSLGARTVAEATTGPNGPGPVHLNLPFREPLLGTAGELPTGRPHGRPWHATTPTSVPVDDLDVAWASVPSGRGLLVAGAGCGDPEAITALAEHTGWPVLADPRSGCRTGHRSVVTTADTVLRSEDLAADLRPDLVVRLGEPPASKVLGAWLAASGACQVVVDRHGRWYDADRIADHVVHADPSALARHLVASVPATTASGWRGRWEDIERAASTALDGLLLGADAQQPAEPELTDPGVARTLTHVLRSLDEPADLVVSSSMPIRDLEWYGGTTGRTRVLANRGANGIDGVVSTAVGVALTRRGSGVRTVALVGDLAFLHDTNALLGLADRGVDLTVVVVDNAGGGIFSFLPPARELPAERFELLFGTPHRADLAGLASAHRLPATVVRAADGTGAFATALTATIDRGGVEVVVAETDRTTNVAFHDHVHRTVHGAVHQALAP